jgi:Ser/Thr protein kinase RdoA (MazF antagonist)
MAVKTAFSKQDFRAILANYDIGDLVDIKPFKLGAVQTNMQLTTTQGRFAFRYYESRPLEYALFEVHLLNYLAQHDFPCPAPISTTRGDLLGNYWGKPFALFIFIDGTHSTSPRNYKQVAAVIGKLHTITVGYQPPYSYARDAYDPASCWRNAEISSKRVQPAAEATARRRWLRAALDQLQLPEGLPRGVCHCDSHYSNFLYKNRKLIAVLDFDDASYVYLLHDIANLIFWWVWPDKGEIAFRQARSLISAYEQPRQLEAIEKTHLFDVLKMVILMGVGWFMDADDDYRNAQRKIAYLDAMGRDGFMDQLFPPKS